MKAISNRGFGNGKAISGNGYGLFQDMLKYKLQDIGKYFVKIGKWYQAVRFEVFVEIESK